ncbi:MAG: hypothetical protein AB7I30_15995, partial [Isosphaeraceae bacterium]
MHLRGIEVRSTAALAARTATEAATRRTAEAAARTAAEAATRRTAEAAARTAAEAATRRTAEAATRTTRLSVTTTLTTSTLLATARLGSVALGAASALLATARLRGVALGAASALLTAGTLLAALSSTPLAPEARERFLADRLDLGLGLGQIGLLLFRQLDVILNRLVVEQAINVAASSPEHPTETAEAAKATSTWSL